MMEKEELKDVLEKHRKYLFSEEGGSYADLRYADLRYANLRSANLRSADLSYADLRSADLRSANLSYANLSYANLRSANLSSADLSSADLRSADLRYADLRYANLSSADLFYTVFSEIKLWPAEEKARLHLKTIVPLDEFDRFVKFGMCIVEGAIFGLMEVVQTPLGWFCISINSPEELPPTDRMIHRILLWRKSKEEFYKTANKQI